MESSLNAAYKELKADVGHFLGYGRGADFKNSEWDDDQLSDIDRSVRGGLRKFYHCGYDWSFLHPTFELTLAAGENTVQLPDDFGGLEGRVYGSVASGSLVVILDDGPLSVILRQEGTSPSAVGRPVYLCREQSKRTASEKSQKQQFHVWPLSDQAYTLKGQYYVLPDMLTGLKPYAYGGPQHAETLLEACLSVAEKILDNKADVHSAEFDKLLAVSQDLDRRNKPQHLGQNRDFSDERRRDRSSFVDRGNLIDSPVLFNGVRY